MLALTAEKILRSAGPHNLLSFKITQKIHATLSLDRRFLSRECRSRNGHNPFYQQDAGKDADDQHEGSGGTRLPSRLSPARNPVSSCAARFLAAFRGA